jgi:hypothetical protein
MVRLLAGCGRTGRSTGRCGFRSGGASFRKR